MLHHHRRHSLEVAAIANYARNSREGDGKYDSNLAIATCCFVGQ